MIRKSFTCFLPDLRIEKTNSRSSEQRQFFRKSRAPHPYTWVEGSGGGKTREIFLYHRFVIHARKNKNDFL
ncbi:hypothetical protein DLM78_03320 [Leptospira stimsonii]|uniref:Uncharacterized protein n=1 Tax=Leptospira stimsonii TaxID=2202203 RepID=A0A8B6RZ78_9LEPT|nr:hypothetical protein DLM78_03320 [Leptospira stimsonii]